MISNTTSKKAKFKIEEIIGLFSSDIQTKEKGLEYDICTDSRSIGKGQIFLPIKGEKFDGHDYINEAIEKGAYYSFCEKKSAYKVNDKYKSKLILVNNTLDAYNETASYYRKKVNPNVIAITGSTGKTTTKNLLVSILSEKYKTHSTEANFNNEIGVPKTILEMEEGIEVLVLELAMRKEGEIKYLTKTAKPDIALITNIGSSHIGRLGSREAIIRAKSEIIEGLNKDGLLVINDDKDLERYVRKKWSGEIKKFNLETTNNIKAGNGKTKFLIDKNQYEVNGVGRQFVLAVLPSILIARHLGLKEEEINKGIAKFSPPEGRGNIIKTKEGNYIIDESYNASPDSVKEAARGVAELWGKSFQKIIVLGEIAELGEKEGELLKELKSYLDKLQPINEIITIGRQFDKEKWETSHNNAGSIEECCNILDKLLDRNKKNVVLVKGSRVSKLEKVVQHLVNSDKTY